jgi:two-component system OmpR family response regulator
MLKLILIVDDDERVYRNTQAFLEDEGYQIIIAVSGERSLLLLHEFKPKFAIVDMRLPGIDGNQFILHASQSQPQFLIHAGSTDHELPDFLRQDSHVRQSIFYKPLFSMEVLVCEICAECIKKIIKLVKMSVFEYIDIPFRLFRRAPCAQKIDT